MRPPVIGITVHVAEVTAKEGHPEWRFQVGARYAEAVREAGGLPLLVPTHAAASARAADVIAAMDAVLLSGGGSIPGRYFVDNPDPSLRDTNPERYDFEVELVRLAWADRTPLLGICRGHQTIAEALGGTILRDLSRVGAKSHYQTEPPTVTTHTVALTGGSALAGWLGAEAAVNSFHRQVVDRPPAGWRTTAVSDDGWTEAIEAEEGFGLGVQFHPEWLTDRHPGFRRVFEEFVLAAKRRAAAATS